jgi:hypothetical protein
MTDCLIIDAHVGIDPVMSPEAMRNEALDKERNHGARGIKIRSAVSWVRTQSAVPWQCCLFAGHYVYVMSPHYIPWHLW